LRINLDVTGRGLLNKYIFTFFFSIIGALINFWFFRAAFVNISEESFYYYAYARRVISFISPVLLAGLTIALPRGIGLFHQYNGKIKRMLFVTFSITLLISILWYALNVFFNDWFTALIWCSVNPFSQKLNQAIGLYIIGLNLFGCMHSYFRGKLQVVYAGLLELLALTLIPLFAFIFLSDLVKIYNLISLVLIVINFLVFISVFGKFKNINIKYYLKEVKELLSYGILRVPGDVVFALLIFLPAFISSRNFGVEYAGIIGFGSAIITLTNLPASSISFVSLSRFAFMLSESKSKLRREVMLLVLGSIIYGGLVSIFLYYSLEYLIELFLDKSVLKYVELMKGMVLAIPPFLVFTILRSLIDAAYKRPFNSYNIIISTFCLLIFSYFSVKKVNIFIIVQGIVFSYTLLAGLSIYRTIKIFKG